jgi:hypothetical protein
MSDYGDIKLHSVSHDIFVEGNELAIILDTTNAIVQRLTIKLQFFKGEWFLNKLFGIPYNQSVFVKGATKAQVDSIFRSQIINTEGVEEIISFNSTFDAATRNYSVGFSCRAVTGDTLVLEI